MKRYELHTGDNREVLKTLADNSVDSIVTDPPYELGFMGKKWDASGIAYNIDVWKECLRVLKPGGHLLAFGGSRTYHRMAVAIEDAGFEVRDCIMWLYGSGFPKSHDVSKALDKQAGAEREVIGADKNFGASKKSEGKQSFGDYAGQWNITAPATPLAQQWQGWGTALKPATENIIMAYKPHGTEHGIIIANLQKLEAQLWLMQYACSAEWSSTSSPSELGVALSIAQWTVAELISTRDDLLGQMDTLQLSEMANMCLSIVQSWKNAWEEASKLGNTFITETVLSPIIGWTTLKSSLSHLTLNFIIREWTQHDTEWLNVLSVASPFIVASKKLKSTLELIAVESAISRTSNPADIDARIAVEPIVVARKPLHGTVADNVTAWGVGALNIDGCRVGTEGGGTHCNNRDEYGRCNGHNNAGRSTSGETFHASESISPVGRWPANIIFDEGAAQMLDEQSGWSKSSANVRHNTGTPSVAKGKEYPRIGIGHSDSGGASRFFYIPKASKAEREAGLEGMEQRKAGAMTGAEYREDRPTNHPIRANHHPTVKPIALMRYLVRLVTPRGGVVLDPFMGSGTTGCAAMLEAMQFIGIELNQEYLDIAERRIRHWLSTNMMKEE